MQESFPSSSVNSTSLFLSSFSPTSKNGDRHEIEVSSLELDDPMTPVGLSERFLQAKMAFLEKTVGEITLFASVVLVRQIGTCADL
jgi:hypothetical protein